MKHLFAAAVLLFAPALAGEPPYTVAPDLFDVSNPDTLGLKPARGTETFAVFRAGEGTDQFVNGVVLIGFKGRLYAQWQSSAKSEDTPDTHVLYATSRDGRRWSKPMYLTRAGAPMTTSGGWWSDGQTLVAYLNTWNSDVHTGGTTAYVTSTDGVHWSAPRPVTDAGGKAVEGVIEQDPHALGGGRIVTAFHLQPGVKLAPFFTDDPLGVTGWTKGQMALLPHEGLESREMEPSWFRRAGCVVMVMRDQQSTFRQLASESCDRGQTWTTPALTAMPDGRQKQSAGNLPDGTAFLVNTPSGQKFRSPLVLTLAGNGTVFNRAFLIRGGPPMAPRISGFYKRGGYHYPKSFVWNGALWIGYANAKEEVIVARVPLESLR